ncbi:hypothetical protein SLS62_004274 [Diatrype stigma]|uniref:Uncharacterized protein n=1 Tax=Diatrype stigma TaxID=117547 RepID=A0AAN9UUX1_9PEZI
MAPETLSLAGKVAIVTGAGREPGIGAGIASALARNSAAVMVNYVSDSTTPKAAALAERLRNEYGARVATVQADITTPEGAAKLAEETLKAFETDHIDILVNNAGHNLPGSTLEAPLEDIDKQFSVNVYGAIRE